MNRRILSNKREKDKNMSGKVLIVVYYWPPSGGIAVQRWLRMSGYFREEGWEPVIVAPEGADYPILDEHICSLLPDGIQVIKIPIWEVRNLYKKIFGRSGKKNVKPDDLFFTKEEDRNWRQKLALWIRGNIFIPDARVTWVKPVTRYLRKYLKENRFDAIITTGPPHSLHLIGNKVKEFFPDMVWLADFRDPWTEIEYHDKMLLSRRAKRKHEVLESKVMQSADVVTTVSKSWAQNFKKKGAKEVAIIINGYDEQDFNEGVIKRERKFTICHAGTMVNDRWVPSFWAAVAELSEENAAFSEATEISVVGRTDSSIWNGFEKLGLIERVMDRGLVSHAEAIQEMKSAGVLLLIINRSEANSKGRLTGKVYEYIAAKRPIVMVGPPGGDAAELIEAGGYGVAVDYNDKVKAKEELLRLFKDWEAGRESLGSGDISHLSRRAAAKRVIEILSREAEN